MNTIPRVWSFVKNTPWAITEEKLEQIVEVIRAKASGVDIAPYAAKERPQPSQASGIAVLPIFGIISQRANMIMDFSGGTSTEQFTKVFRQVMADPEIGSIVLEIDSPGGSVFGVPELAAEILRARNQKPIIAVANSFAASAAYWLASSASEIFVSPSGMVGSIGVYSVHQDFSQANEKLGIKPTYVSAGKYKTESNPDEPLNEEARANMQAEVDRYYSMFTKSVADGRAVKQTEVVNGFGQGRMVGGKEAVALGMADGVATIDQVLMRIAKPGANAGRLAAFTDDEPAIAAVEEKQPEPEPALSDEDMYRRSRLAYA